jgi:organic anion transporter 4A
VTYIDECVGPDSSAFYLGVFYTMAILGPALGYSIGGQFLNIHADFLRFFLHLFLPRFLLTF